jgi:DNA-binding transcriptional ArsR family regulator
MKPHTDITDPTIARALAHPLRLQILSQLEKETASPSDLSKELDAPLGVVSYHVRQLADSGLIKLVKRTPRRGAIEHHYRAEPRPRISDDAWADVPAVVKEATVASAISALSTRVNAAATLGAFSRSDAHLSRTDVVVDAQGWSELAEVLADTLKRVEKIETESAKRLKRANHAGDLKATVALLLFETVFPDPRMTGNRRPAQSKSRRVRSS